MIGINYLVTANHGFQASVEMMTNPQCPNLFCFSFSFLLVVDMKEDAVCRLTLMLPTVMHWAMLLELSSRVGKLG